MSARPLYLLPEARVRQCQARAARLCRIGHDTAEIRHSIATVERELKDPATVATEYFHSYYNAKRYYADYLEYTSATELEDYVQEKIDEGAIKIGKPEGGVRVNSEGRWVVPVRDHKEIHSRLDKLKQLLKNRHALYDRGQGIFARLRVLARVAESTQITKFDDTTQAEFRRAHMHLTERWPRDLPYCTVGFPHYPPQRMTDVENQPENTRVAVFTQLPGVALAYLRAVKGASGVCWGMQDGKHELVLLDHGQVTTLHTRQATVEALVQCRDQVLNHVATSSR